LTFGLEPNVDFMSDRTESDADSDSENEVDAPILEKGGDEEEISAGIPVSPLLLPL
jgi:hypothetical protein